MDNPFEEARDVLLDIQDDLRDLSFDDIFDIDIEQYLPSYDQVDKHYQNTTSKSCGSTNKSISIFITDRINTFRTSVAFT